MFLLVRVAFVAEFAPIVCLKKSRQLCDGIEMIIEVEQINLRHNLLVFRGRRFKNLAVSHERIMHRNAILRR